MIEAIKEVLKGIDQTELESTDGWWETSAGAEFGAKKLKYILGLLAQPEQPKVRTGDCLLVGVCASEGHKIQVKQEPWRESASDYERGVIDGRQMQAQSSVDKAVNRMAQPEQEPVATLDDLEQEIYENTRQFVSRDVMEWMLKRYYTTPPQRKPLTDEQIEQLEQDTCAMEFPETARAIEQALKERNT